MNIEELNAALQKFAHAIAFGGVDDRLREAEAIRLLFSAALAQPVKPLDHLEDIAAYIGVGGYNGATTEQLVNRIGDEFVRITAQPAKPVESLTDEYLESLRDKDFRMSLAAAAKERT
jgi:hypothetical protein